jgi:DNA-binding MarR family transcriptional regulator
LGRQASAQIYTVPMVVSMDDASSSIAQEIWAAVNAESMNSSAWGACFRDFPDLRYEKYKQLIFFVVVLSVRRPHECTMSTIQRVLSQRDLLDQKTISVRVETLIDCQLLARTDHPTDKRKQLIHPTKRLLTPLREYSQLVHDIAAEILSQAPLSAVVRPLDDARRFNLLDYLREASVSPPAVQANKAVDREA